MKWLDHDEPPACWRLHAWLNVQDTHASDRPAASVDAVEDMAMRLQSAAASLRTARRPLIWLESVDVHTARAAVELARMSGATLHVAQSPGAELVANITATDGWLGTTLAEVRSTASLVIHVGQQHLRDAPMLASRFMNPQTQHVFLHNSPDSWLEDVQLQDSTIQMNWSKETWLDRLTRALLLLQDDSAALARRADEVDGEVGMLAELLLGSHYSVIVWSEDALSDETDILLVRRLLELARQVSRTARCSLLCLSQDPGRVTAKDSLLWLTNRTTPMRFAEREWAKDYSNHYSLEQWQRTFDWMLCVRTLPSDRPLPELRFDVVLDARCNGSMHALSDAKGATLIPVPAVGLDVGGSLLRADHGLAAFLPPVNGDSSSPMLSASDLLKQMASLVQGSQQPTTQPGDN